MAPTSARAEQAIALPTYRTLRYEEDYAYLRDPTRRRDPWDIVKFIPLNANGSAYLTLGGEVRERYEYYRNDDWGAAPQDPDGYLLQRYMLHADLHTGQWFRLFAQLKSALATGRTGGPRSTDEDELDVNQAFVDLTSPSTAALTLRLGRQELSYGSQRLVSVRESPNVRRTFDAVRLLLAAHAWRIDAFAAKPVETDPGVFDDEPEHERSFWGIYSVGPSLSRTQGIDLYYLGYWNQHAQFDQQRANETRHSLGTRLWGTVAGLDYNLEPVFQTGEFGSGTIVAWTVASDTGYTLGAVPTRPRVGLKVNVASGDRDPRRRDLNTFNALFPRGAYFGEVSLIGPANFMDLHPSITMQPIHSVTVTIDWDFFWRESLRDGVYDAGGNLTRSAGGSRARYVGSQASGQAEWRVDPHLTLVTAYAHFFAGPFIDETGPAEDVDYVSAWATYRF